MVGIEFLIWGGCRLGAGGLDKTAYVRQYMDNGAHTGRKLPLCFLPPTGSRWSYNRHIDVLRPAEVSEYVLVATPTRPGNIGAAVSVLSMQQVGQANTRVPKDS
jgi:hypothetical protein